MGSGCAGDLSQMGAVLRYDGKSAFAVWPNVTSKGDQNFSVNGFPTMAQITAGNMEIANISSSLLHSRDRDEGAAWVSAQSKRWDMQPVEGFNGLLSPPQLLEARDRGYKPYQFSTSEGGSDTLKLFVPQVTRPLTLYTGEKLHKALEATDPVYRKALATGRKDAAAKNTIGSQQSQVEGGTTSSLLYSGGSVRERARGLRRQLTVELEEKENEVEYLPDAHMQVRVKGLTANRYAISKDVLDNTPGGRVPRGYSGITSLAYTTGFPSWISLPLWVYAPSALNISTNIDLTRPDGSRVLAQGSEEKENTKQKVFTPRSGDWTLQTYLDVEPVTGATINAHKRLMASFAVPQMDSQSGSAGASKGVGDLFVAGNAAATNVFAPELAAMVLTPVYYLDEHSTITDSDADTLKLAITVDSASNLVLYILTPIGAVFFVYGLHLCLHQRRKEKIPKSLDAQPVFQKGDGLQNQIQLVNAAQP